MRWCGAKSSAAQRVNRLQLSIDTAFCLPDGQSLHQFFVRFLRALSLKKKHFRCPLFDILVPLLASLCQIHLLKATAANGGERRRIEHRCVSWISPHTSAAAGSRSRTFERVRPSRRCQADGRQHPVWRTWQLAASPHLASFRFIPPGPFTAGPLLPCTK